MREPPIFDISPHNNRKRNTLQLTYSCRLLSGSWMKNAQYVNYVDQQIQVNNNDMVIPTNNTMSAKAVLISRPNSHPFQERTLSLDQPVKVGRSVARARATPTNAIFDCKVLSRHHALLWYDCGKFYLQDTKSSNGTFVNNNRLSSTESEPHEVSSGDIVQFGVDVVENNRKVTHGCIIATLKLYLPDGKEAKASPSIAEGNRHGLVPLDELYKLNQIIQEASQREQCLETKLTALQHVVEAARRAADESWQAYVGEERLLSRVAALETQLMQANKGFGDDRLREELNKLQEDRAEYQVAAKEALRKLHAERLEAVASAAEQQRARATAEHEAILAKEQLEQAQLELQDIAHKLSEEQKKSDEERSQLEQREKELQAELEVETQRVVDLQNKLEQLRSLALHPGDENLPLEELEKYNLIYNDDFSAKEELIAENETGQGDVNRTNGLEQNHINLTVVPVSEQLAIESSTTMQVEADSSISESTSSLEESLTEERTINEDVDYALEKEEKSDYESEVKIKEEPIQDYECEVDTRTLKYQYQTAQNELKKQIEQLEIISSANKTKIALLEKSLMNEKEEKSFLLNKADLLKEEFICLENKYLESVKETNELREKVEAITSELGKAQDALHEAESKKAPETSDFGSQVDQIPNVEDEPKTEDISKEEGLEEELVLLKERYALVNEEKIALNKELVHMHAKYNALCDRSYTTLFFYVAPLVIMVLYLLISSMFS